MRPFLLLAVLFAACAQAQGSDIADGSVVYNYNGNRLIQKVTKSPITHVGLIINKLGEPWVYEADEPCVRCIRFSEYLISVKKFNEGRKLGDEVKVYVLQPTIRFKPHQINNMKKYLDSKIGTEYSVFGFLHKEPWKDKLHCVQLAEEALGQTGRYKFKNPVVWSPKCFVGVMREYSRKELIAILP